MKRLNSWFVRVALLSTVSVLAAFQASAQTKYSVVEVKHLTKADSVSLSQEYLNYSYDDLREELTKQGVFGRVVGDGDPIAEADAANAAVLKCNITEFKSGGLMPPWVTIDITLSNRGDGTAIKQFSSGKLPLNNGGRVPSDEVKAKNTGRFLAEVIKHDLK